MNDRLKIPTAPMTSVRDLSLLSERAAPARFGRTAPGEEVQAKEAATQFEALLLKQMFQSMWASVPNDGLLSGGREEEYFRDMLNEALAQSVSKGQGIGIRDVVLREMTKKKE